MMEVRSVLPESTTTISSTIPFRDNRARGKLCSSLSVIRQAERRFIGCASEAECYRRYLTLTAHRVRLQFAELQDRKHAYFFWKLTRIRLSPMRNSEPSCSIAARTRSSS